MTDGERWVVVDVEATCWHAEEHPALAADQGNETEGDRDRRRPARSGRRAARGAVPGADPAAAAPAAVGVLHGADGPHQADVDAAARFPAVLAALFDWAGGDEGLVLAAWGGFDDRLLRRDAERWGCPPRGGGRST
ncbi:MAG: hypothetical protein R3F59_29730 [Myxococcota bacterium]